MPLKRTILLILGPLAFLMIHLVFEVNGLTREAIAVLAITVWVAIWWIGEVIPLGVTALLPFLWFPILGVSDMATTGAVFGNPIIFLFLGGFIIAAAMEKWNLHRRLAIFIISAIGTNPPRIILGFMVAAAVLSMWISNTATAMMMVPMGLSLTQELAKPSEEGRSPFSKALMLSVAYGCSIGGIATLIGTPTNVIFTGIVKETLGEVISFSQWMTLGLPLSMILLAIGWWYLVKVAFRLETEAQGGHGGRERLQALKAQLPDWTYEEKWIIAVFGTVAVGWVVRPYIFSEESGVTDAFLALAGAVVLFIIPSKQNKDSCILDWPTAVRIPWDIILLFAGGLALANGFIQTGLASWLGGQFAALEGFPYWILLLLIVGAMNFLTEITSNVATASMILPVLIATAQALDLHPYGIMIGATLAASCAFMLPVATPPNCVVFGSGEVRIQEMVRAGFWMNVISIAIITLYVYFLLPLVFDIDIWGYPF